MEFTDPAANLDPDLGDLELGTEDSDYDQLDDELTVIVEATTLIEVPKRPGYAIRCRTDYTGLDVELIRKKCRDKKFADGIDGVKFASLLLASTCVAVVRNGADLELDGESPITFVSKPLQTRMGTTTAADTVLKFYVREGHVDAAAGRLSREAGWGDEVYTADPTQ
jgi:hypothetical protein